MFKSLSMKHVDIFVLKNDVENVAKILYDLKLMEFFSKEEKGFEKFEQEDTSYYSSQLLTLRATITYLKPYFTKTTEEIDENPIEKVKEYQNKKEKLNHDLSKLKDEEKRNKVLVNLNVSKSAVERGDILIGFISKQDSSNLKLLKKEGNLIASYQLENRVYFATSQKTIPFTYKEFYLPKKVNTNITLDMKEKEKQLNEIEILLERIANGNLLNLQQEELHLSKKVSFLEAKEHFNKTQHITALSGYVPAKDTKKLQRSLEAELGDKFHMEIQEPKKHEDVPTLLNHTTTPAKSFENLLNMYSLPNYKELDPTILMLLVFPLFYGFVLGDFGYGIISLIVFSLAKFYFTSIKNFLSILQLSSISSMIFGVIYGEYFGYEPHFFAFEFARSHQPEMLLAIAVLFGIIHLNVGLIIGFINEMKHSIKHAVYEKLSWIGIQLGLLFGYLGVTGEETLITSLGVGIMIISLILLYRGHGFVGIIEIPSFFTNILSYARLMAVGTSSVVIAMLINQYTSTFFSMGLMGVIAGITLFTLGHIFNIILGNFESFLHTLRLHYVEFFLRFYQGGGRDFKPFGERIHEYNE